MTSFARVTEAGEIIVPAEMARSLGLVPGEMLIMDADGSNIVVKTYADVVREGQRAYRATIKRSFTVDEFLADRRTEAAAD